MEINRALFFCTCVFVLTRAATSGVGSTGGSLVRVEAEAAEAGGVFWRCPQSDAAPLAARPGRAGPAARRAVDASGPLCAALVCRATGPAGVADTAPGAVRWTTQRDAWGDRAKRGAVAGLIGATRNAGHPARAAGGFARTRLADVAEAAALACFWRTEGAGRAGTEQQDEKQVAHVAEIGPKACGVKLHLCAWVRRTLGAA